MGKLHSWYRASRAAFIARLAAMGAVAGWVSWLVALAVYPLFGARRPSLLSLLLAIPRGALFGALLALALGVYWDWRSRQRGQAS